MVHVHTLAGCSPTPLANYLKALGVLRLVSEQADTQARGFWKDERFVLVSRLSAEELESFFVDAYSPTPLIAPWNGGSGFYPKDNSAALEAIESNQGTRFAAYREAILWGRLTVGHLSARPDKKEKPALLRRCRAEWGDKGLDWFNAAVTVLGDDAKYPALLGTGGNDGRLDFTNNFMQRLVELLSATGQHAVRAWLRASLFGNASSGLAHNAIGQFAPGSAGGMNAGPGFSADAVVNSWDFVLMLEGALVLQVAAVRQLDAVGLPGASAPFAFRARAAGYGSAARSEESARGEQWMPLWERPLRYCELRSIFREGRMQERTGRARQPVGAAKAIAAHGTARGITAFQRFGFIERNGLSNLAVPLGRWTVSPSPAARLIDDIDQWVEALRRQSGDTSDPASLRRHVRGLETAMLQVLQKPGAARLQDLLMRLGDADHGLLTRPKHTADRKLRPLSTLSQEWLSELDDNSAEFRLAVSFATQWSKDRDRPLRAHVLPVGSRRDHFDTGPSGLRVHPGVVWQGRDLVDDLVHLVQRRLLEANGDHPGLALAPRYAAELPDVHAFVFGEVDDRKLARLARGLMGLSRPGADRRVDLQRPKDCQNLLPAYALLRCAHPGFQPKDLLLRPMSTSRAVNLLVAERSDAAAAVLSRRFVALGLRPKLSHLIVDRSLGRRLVASLMFPVSTQSLSRLLNSISHNPTTSEGVSHDP